MKWNHFLVIYINFLIKTNIFFKLQLKKSQFALVTMELLYTYFHNNTNNSTHRCSPKELHIDYISHRKKLRIFQVVHVKISSRVVCVQKR